MFKKVGAADPDQVVDQRYYEQGASWERSHYRMLRGAAAFWRLYGLCASAVIAGLIVCLILIIPTVRTEVVALEVDHTTGYLKVIQPLENTANLKDNDAVTAFNIVQFIQARETYDPRAIQDNHDKALLFSKDQAAKDIVNLYQASNPNNPVKLYGPSSSVSVSIESLNFLNSETALVRFTTTTKSPTGPPDGITYYWSANVRFAYSSAPLRMDWRLINPLGFQIYEYRRDQERIAPVVNKEAPK